MYNISRYEPTSILNEVNKIIEQAFRPLGKTDASTVETSQWMPAVDIREDKNQFYIVADLPGVEKKDVNISMENNLLTIKGSRDITTEEEHANYFRTERVRGTFYRQFTLPDTADDSKIEARMQKGVLEIIIPKKESAQPRSIKIEIEE
jgi:HSP20 family protein